MVVQAAGSRPPASSVFAAAERMPQFTCDWGIVRIAGHSRIQEIKSISSFQNSFSVSLCFNPFFHRGDRRELLNSRYRVRSFVFVSFVFFVVPLVL